MSVSRVQNVRLGVFYGVLAAICLPLMSVAVKHVSADLPTTSIIFFRFGLSFLFILPWIIKDKTFTLKVKQPVRYVLRIFSALIAMSCIFYSLKYLPLVDVLLLSNTSPLFVPLIVWLMLGIKTSKKALTGIGIGFLGLVVFLRPSDRVFSPISLIALASGLLTAMSFLQMRLISKMSSTNQILFYYIFLSALASGCVAIFNWKTPETLNTWLILLFLGAMGTLFQTFITLCYSTAPVRLMSPLLFLSVVFGGVLDWIFWGRVPDMISILGGVIVILGAVITIFFGQKEIMAQVK